MFTSWQTTIGGILAAIGAGLSTIPEWDKVGAAITALGVAIMGIAARDNNVSSEKAHAK